MTKVVNNNKDDKDKIDLSFTDILQAHDILISILLGQLLSQNKHPIEMINHILQMTDMQSINPNARKHITLLLEPLKAALERDAKK